ncbi:PREDICTED: cyclic AMP-dependent transcription factor ATF-6 alpha isoform X1 [Cyprinodon variegatus]|uniref:cyclic AMP-dependent transcription factor ATF-6 alpha isoform X1 n=1 Tax=Cyprinodon variegatus TaxID=28743 RepID=UPI000742534D|nr:PREDICTED: cyclic AMP-dependent transcription factor ATF-6 alpha isoform X1 [Cyprinodon variegatus]
MSSDLKLDFGNCHQDPVKMDSETSMFSIDQGGEWDLSLFDELENFGDADELLEALENGAYVGEGHPLDFDIDIPPWNETDTSSTCTDGEVSVDSLSPAHTLSSVPSPASIEALSPSSLHDEALSPQSQLSPISVSSESSGFSEASPPPKKVAKRSTQGTRAKPAQPAKRPIQMGPKFSIQPKPLIAAMPLAPAAAPLQAKTIIIQPLQTAMLPVVKPAPVSIQPAPSTGHSIVLSQPSQLLQIQAPQAVPASVVAVPTLNQDKPVPVAAPPMVSVTLRTPSSDEDTKFSQKQQRMIKNRESASLSRKKKKEYLLSLEARLKVALSENEALKCENGNLKKQLEGLLSENSVLKATAPKRRAVCLMAVLVFLVLNVGPTSLFQSGSLSNFDVAPMQHAGRHLLEFSAEAEADVVLGPELTSRPSELPDRSEDKALMVVKSPDFLRPPPPCQPPVNRTKCIELAHELRGWVHRHEVQQTNSRRMSNSHHKAIRNILQKTENKEDDLVQIVPVPYGERAEKKNPGNEVQIYYAPQHTYSDFFDELNRRADTFYVVSFRRDHLLLPATNHNKGSRPKMSVVLPAMNINDSIIKDKEFEVMMQIDCEVTDTKIIHIRSSSIPPLLRVNQTDTFYQRAPTDGKPAPPVGVLMGSS